MTGRAGHEKVLFNGPVSGYHYYLVRVEAKSEVVARTFSAAIMQISRSQARLVQT